MFALQEIQEAQESPLEPGVYITPTHSTEIAAPTFNSETENCVWNNNEWVITIIPIPDPIPDPIVIVDTVSMRQARLALFKEGKLSQIQSLIDAMEEPAKTTTQISWDYATVVQRDDELVVQLSTALGLTQEQLDTLFTEAATL